MADFFDLTTLSALIDGIYECALRPEKWAEVLVAIEAKLGAISSYLVVHDVDAHLGDTAMLLNHNVDPEWSREYIEHYLKLNPLLPYLSTTRTGEIFATRHLVGKSDYLKGQFYNEWARPQRWFDYAGVTMLRGRDSAAAIGFARTGEGNVFDDEALRLLGLLAPHLTRVAAIDRMLARERWTNHDLAAALGATRFGALVLDEAGRLLFANAAAETLLAKRDGIAAQNGMLAAGRATSELRATLAAAAKRGAARGGATFKVERGEERAPLILHALPLAGAARDTVRPPSAAAAIVLVVDPEAGLARSIAAFAEAFGLTRAERQVLARLALGESPEAIAARLSTEIATIRSHLHRLFAKTGTRRQAELVALLLRSTPPLR
jgi:DNA-binding CsgD family transcriptional regulator